MSSAVGLNRNEIRRQRRRPPLVTQTELAKRLHTNQTNYSRWETGALERLPWEQDEQDAWEALQALKAEKRAAVG